MQDAGREHFCVQANVSFRRAQYVLYDLRYLLAVPPDVWTERLRKGFLYGVGSLLTLLTWMQGMDSVLRQVSPPLSIEALQVVPWFPGTQQNTGALSRGSSKELAVNSQKSLEHS